MKEKLVLIDGSSIAYRAFFALPLLNNDKGIHTNAIYGFSMMLLKILEAENPTHIAVAFDAGKKTFRHESYEDYKGGRQKTPPELTEQFPFIRELITSLGIHHVELLNYEADDLIGTYAKQADEKGIEVKVISGDKDLLQLVSPHVTVSLTKKGITDTEDYNPEALFEKYGLKPEQMIEMKGLMGDSSDNIPGIPGVGEKTALKLLHQYHTIEGIYEHIDEQKGKLKEKLELNKDLAFLSRELATIHREVPVDTSLENTHFDGIDVSKTRDFFREFGFTTLLNKLPKEAAGEGAPEVERVKLEVKKLTSIFDLSSADEVSIVLELSSENYHKAELTGVGLYCESGAFFMDGQDFLNDSMLPQFLENEMLKKLTFDSKKLYSFFKWQGIETKGIEFDLMLATYLINPSANVQDLHSAVQSFEQVSLRHEDDVYGKGASFKMPSEEIRMEFLAQQAKVIFDLKDQCMEQLEDEELQELLFDLEMPLALILGDMEVQGFAVNVNMLESMKETLSDQLQAMEERIHMLAGSEFNINSPKQLGVILFEKLQLPVQKKTKTGYSTSADVLEKLQGKHEIIDEILSYRQLGKLYSTYVEGLLKVVDPATHKIHTRFQQAVTQTGRLSSTEPNLQNIPIRLEEGRKIREAFIPSKEGHYILAADYSQIELRVLAHIAEDKNLIDAFNHDLDIHTKTAMDVFHVPMEEVTSLMRRQAKAVNFGIVYGISDFGLSQNLNITRKAAGEFIKRYFEIFSGVEEYMEEIVKKVKKEGYVTTLMHRRRYIPDIHSRNFNIRSFAERTAMNTPIQGSAADIIKKAMIDMKDQLLKNKLQSKMLLQVHDELIFEVPEAEIDTMVKLVEETMENTIELKVPLKVDAAYGKTWFDTK